MHSKGDTREGATLDRGDASISLPIPSELRVPDEARRWWKWHDGVAASDIRYRYQRAIGPPDLDFVPLEEAVAAYVRTQSGYEQRHTASGGPQLWDPQWLPFTIASGHVLCDCSVAPEEPTPIRLYDPGALGEAVREPRAQSLGELVGWWLEAFSSGAWRFVKAADDGAGTTTGSRHRSKGHGSDEPRPKDCLYRSPCRRAELEPRRAPARLGDATWA
jgi:hypothetical protein